MAAILIIKSSINTMTNEDFETLASKTPASVYIRYFMSNNPLSIKATRNVAKLDATKTIPKKTPKYK